MIEFRTLGSIDLRDPGNGSGLDAILSRSKRVALLSYLALARPRGFHRRDSLFLHFWPEVDGDRARKALNQSSYVLRKALGEGVLVSRGDGELGLDPNRIWCDAAAFEHHLDSNEPEAALELYGGDLLAGFYLPDCPDFERWLDFERIAHRRKALAAAQELASRFEDAGNTTEAAHWLRRAARWAPYEEPLFLDLLALLGRHGDRAGARREYDAFARRISEDLGLDPSPDASDLLERIERNELSARKNILLESVSKDTTSQDIDLKPADARPRRRWPLVAVASVMLLAVGAYGRWLTGDPNLPAGVQPSRLMVATFASEMAADAPMELGLAASNRVAEALSKSGLVEVVPPSETTRWRHLLIEEGYGENDPAIVRATAERAGAGLLVTGSYSVLGDSAYFRARVLDVRRGTLLRSTEVLVVATGSPAQEIEGLADRVVGAVGTVVDSRFAAWSHAATLPANMESYLGYSRGVDEWRSREWKTAAETFIELARSDSSFTAALVWATASRLAEWEGLEHLDREAERRLDSLLALLEPRRDALPGWERAMLDYVVAARSFDNPRAHGALREVVRIGPGTDFVLLLAGVTRTLDRPIETRETLTLIDPNSLLEERHRWLYWIHYLWAHHRTANFERELEVARSLKGSYPEAYWVHAVEIRALAAVGRQEEARDLFEVVYSVRGPSRMRGMAAEFRAHGFPDLVHRMSMDLLAEFEAVPESERDDKWLYERALLLEEVTGLEEAIEAIDRIGPDSPRRLDARASRGVYAAQQGDSVLALQILEELEAIPQSGYRWHTQARIAAELGDKERAVALLRRMTSPVRGMMHRELMFPTLRGYEPFEELERPRG